MKTINLSIIILFSMLFSCDESDSDLIIVEKKLEKIETQSVVFITGIDEDDNTFYKNAKNHFSEQHLEIVEGIKTIEEIILWLNENADGKNYDAIHIVSRGNAFTGLSINGEGDRMTAKLLEGTSFPKPNKAITKSTNIIFHSCGMGGNKELMQVLKSIFSNEISPKFYASENFNIFGGKFASHYLAKPFYVFYPTGKSPGNEVLADEIGKRNLSAYIDWSKALQTQKEGDAGAVFSYRFNIPMEWKFDFKDENGIPELENEEEIIDYILRNKRLSLDLFQLGIPIEKFSWNSETNGKTLTIIGESTVICVLVPLMDSYFPAEYSVADFTHPRLYTKF